MSHGPIAAAVATTSLCVRAYAGNRRPGMPPIPRHRMSPIIYTSGDQQAGAMLTQAAMRSAVSRLSATSSSRMISWLCCRLPFSFANFIGAAGKRPRHVLRESLRTIGDDIKTLRPRFLIAAAAGALFDKIDDKIKRSVVGNVWRVDLGRLVGKVLRSFGRLRFLIVGGAPPAHVLEGFSRLGVPLSSYG